MEYTLEKVLVVSRHNIRAPLMGKGSILERMTPHAWADWGVAAGELTQHGAEMELKIGRYFANYMEQKGLIARNWIPKESETRFFSNSLQRTIATARAFSCGFLPVSDVKVEYRGEFNSYQPMFMPTFPDESEKYRALAECELGRNQKGGKDGLRGIAATLTEEYRCLAEILDLQESEEGKKGKTSFSPETSRCVYRDKSIYFAGDYENAHLLADALFMQYYELQDGKAAAFGKEVSEEDWRKLARIVDTCLETLCTSEKMSCVFAHDLLQEILLEFQEEKRKFTFISGHDMTVLFMFSVLRAGRMRLEDTFIQNSPIGMKIVFEIWHGSDQKKYVHLYAVYPGMSQICGKAPLGEKDPPMSCEVVLADLERNEKGYYSFDEIRERLEKAVQMFA